MGKKTVFFLNAALLALASLMALPAYSATATDEEQTDLLFTREEEKLARDTYLTLYDQWNLGVFSNIASSEQSHMDAILKLLLKYNLPDPAANNGIGEFTNATLQALYITLIAKGETSGLDALEVGGIIEETDMRDIQAAIDRAQHEDIKKTYATLMCGSRNHLRSFAQSIEALTGKPYEAQVLTQAEVDAILASPMERCGNTKLPPGLHLRQNATGG